MLERKDLATSLGGDAGCCCCSGSDYDSDVTISLVTIINSIIHSLINAASFIIININTSIIIMFQQHDPNHHQSVLKSRSTYPWTRSRHSFHALGSSWQD